MAASRTLRLLALVSVMVAGWSVACSTDDTTVPTGTTARDGGTIDQTEPDAAPDGDRPEDRADAGTGTRWTDLYRDFFAPAAPASCAGDGLCHGSMDKAGARGSGGFICPTQDGCWASMTGPDAGLVTPSDTTDPANSALLLTLRHRREDGSVAGTMPKRPVYVFSTASIERIATWIQNGAPND